MVLTPIRTLVLSVALALTALLYVSVPAFAAAPNGNSAGIGIKPAVVEDSANPGITKDYTVTISNLSNTQQTYYLSTKDIVDVTDGGTPVYAAANAEKTGFEMSSWITLSTDQITLAPQQESPVTINVAVPANASPGSHFAGVFVSMVPPKMRNNGAAVGYEVANIISLRVAGDAVTNAQIRQFSTGNYIYGSSNIDFHTIVENKGNVLVRPTGPLEIFNMFGKRVAMLTMNDSQAGVFPGRTRNFDLTWNGDGPGFGRYQAILSMVYGDQGLQSTISSTVTFWILPMNIILPALGVLAFLLLATYIAVRMYIRNKLRMVSGGARRVNRRQRRGGVSSLLLVTIVMLAVTAFFLLVLLALFS